MATDLQIPAAFTAVQELIRSSPVRYPLLRARTWTAMAIWLLGTDLAIYRGGGWTGWAAALALVPIVIAIGPRKQSSHFSSWLIVCLLIAWIALKLIWCGSVETVLAGCVLALATILVGQGLVPYVGLVCTVPLRMVLGIAVSFGETLFPASQAALDAGGRRYRMKINGPAWAGVALPMLAVAVFGGIFVLANPNFRIWCNEQFQLLSTLVEGWLTSLDVREMLFWGFSGAMCLAMLFPYISDLLDKLVVAELAAVSKDASLAVYFYPAARNTLSALVVLFAAYLVYEFSSMWWRTFPVGFYYAGYAHEGAFWLTVALALAVFTLSAIFSQAMRRGGRVDKLKWLAWLWSAENFLLAAGVYNRLLIYIDFNGMTRMRVIGLLGVAAVVAGFCLVVYKIGRRMSFQWLIQRQLWALGLSMIAYAALPVDWLVHAHNARQVLAGDRAPSVQMIAHETRADGMLRILGLIDCDDPEIREGVRAMAADWSGRLDGGPPTYLPGRHRSSTGRSARSNPSDANWSRFQISEKLLRRMLDANRSKLAEYLDPSVRAPRLKRFYDYAYQWY